MIGLEIEQWLNIWENGGKYYVALVCSLLFVFAQNQEIEELTKICDELIAKLGTANWTMSTELTWISP